MSRRSPFEVCLCSEDRAVLEAVVANRNSPQKHAWRAKIVLLTADGHGTAEIMRATGKTFPQILEDLSAKSGLLGISGLSADCRDLEEAAAKGHARAALAMNVFAASIRQYIGAYLTVLNGADAIVFTGGIGENSQWVRTHATRNLDYAGIKLDETLNQSGKGEAKLSTASSRTQIWTLPTNEEIVVARQSVEAVKNAK